MEDQDFNRSMSIHGASYSDLFSDEHFENEEWAKYRYINDLKVSLHGEKEALKKVFRLLLNSFFLVKKDIDDIPPIHEVLDSAEDTIHLSTGHHADVNSDINNSTGGNAGH